LPFVVGKDFRHDRPRNTATLWSGLKPNFGAWLRMLSAS
jgi:hypothetical protein